MPGFTVNGQFLQDSPSLDTPTPPNKIMSRQTVIEIGIHALHKIGSDHICKICIANGGSCCNGCKYLTNGIGCQQRNTSCTAWLCGFLKLLLYETGLLQEWVEFWDQVPGQAYREDFTPEFFLIEKSSLDLQHMQILSEALAADLKDLAEVHIALGFIITLREKIDKNIDQLNHCKHDPKKESKLKRNIKMLSSHFHRFHKELREYHQKFPPTS